MEFRKMLKNLGQKEDVVIYVSTLLPAPQACGGGRKGRQA